MPRDNLPMGRYNYQAYANDTRPGGMAVFGLQLQSDGGSSLRARGQ